MGLFLHQKKNLNVLVIDSLEDAREISKEYGYLNEYHARQIDFIELSKHYDALHLTGKGLLDCASDYGLDPLIATWDCESTVWFNWCFEDHIKQYKYEKKNSRIL